MNYSSPKEELYDTAAGFVLLGSTILVLVSSLLSFAYMYLYLKLNGFIKTILYQMSTVGIVGSLIMIIGEAIILIKKEQTFATCCMIHYSGFLVVFMDVFMTAMISALRYSNHCLISMDFLSLFYIFFRYYMAWKASKTQFVKPKVIMRVIIGGISFQICFAATTILIQNWLDMTSEPITCSNLEHTVSIEAPYMSILVMIELTVVVHFGLVFDFLLYFLMKQRNAQLVQWKSSQDQLAVPIKATLVSTVSLFMILICGPMCFTSWYSGKILLWLGVILGSVWVVGHVPALLFFTICHQKKVEQIQPPIELQFHGENFNFDDAKNPQLPGKEIKLYQQRTPIFIVEEALPNQII